MSDYRRLFPHVEPYMTGLLEVSTLHTIYFEQVGNPDGIPVVFLHGGPGVGVQKIFRRFFDPKRFRVILFSQRGAGKSAPTGALEDNTTCDLVKDIETLRESLNIQRWFVFGGSWGSTLALTYAQIHSDRVRGMVLQGIYLGNRSEHHWLYEDGASRIFPEQWQEFSGYIPYEERAGLVSAYYNRLTSSDQRVQFDAAKHWYGWEESLLSLIPRAMKHMEDNDLLAFARIECHYVHNRLFFPEDDYLINRAGLITHIPCWIAHGRYDVITPVASALELHKALPNSYLHITPDAGHLITEPGLVDSLIRGIEYFAERY